MKALQVSLPCSLSLWSSLALSLVAACATAPSGPSLPPVSLAETCPRGPFCVTGQIDDQFALPVAGVRCFVRHEDGQISAVSSDARGVYLIDSLTALPAEVGFEKAGFETRAVPLRSGGAGVPARTYVTLSRKE